MSFLFWLFCPGCPVWDVLSRPPCPGCPLLLSCSVCLFCPACSVCYVLPVLSSCPVLVVSFWLSCPGCSVLTRRLLAEFPGYNPGIQPWQTCSGSIASCPGRPVLGALRPVLEACLGYLVLTGMSWQSCPSSPVLASCFSSPVLAVLFWRPLLAGLSWQAYLDRPILAACYDNPVFWPSCIGNPVLAVSFCLSHFACPFLSGQSFPSGPFWQVPSLLSYPGSLLLPVKFC
jgi:hypothetical protein